MDFLRSLLNSEPSSSVGFLQTNINECKENIVLRDYTLLQKGCSLFSVDNLECVKEELAVSWMVLFQLHAEQLQQDSLRVAVQGFEKVFRKRTVRELFLKEFLRPCKQQIKEKNYSLLIKACSFCSVEALQSVKRKTAIRWMQLFELHEEHLDRQKLASACTSLHQVFTVHPSEAKKNITVICLDEQEELLPLPLLLTNRVFQEMLTSKSSCLRLERTIVEVVRLFKNYLYRHEIPEEGILTDPNYLVQLLDIARWIQDEHLIQLCQDRFQDYGRDHYLQLGSLSAVAGEASLKNKRPEQAKEYFIAALKQRPTDCSSRAALGHIAMQEEDYKGAMIDFENASKYAPFRHDLVVFQAKATVEYIKKLVETIGSYCESALNLYKKRILREKVGNEEVLFFQKLRSFCLYTTELNENIFFNKIVSYESLVTQKKLKQDHFLELIELLKSRMDHVKQGLLDKAEKLLKAIPPDYDKSKVQYLLEGEIEYEKGNPDKAVSIFYSLGELVEQNQMLLSSKEKVDLYYNWAKVYMHHKVLILPEQNTAEVIKALSAAMLVDCEDVRIKRALLVYHPPMTLRCASELDEMDCEAHYACGMVLFNEGKLEEAKSHFLKADVYRADVNYFLGKIDEAKKGDYFRVALVFAQIDALPIPYCLEIVAYLVKIVEKREFASLANLLMQLKIPSKEAFEASDLLFYIAEKIEDTDFRKEVEAKACELNPNSASALAKKLKAISLEPQLIEIKSPRSKVPSESTQQRMALLKERLLVAEGLLKKAEGVPTGDQLLIQAQAILETLLPFFQKDKQLLKLMGKCYLQQQKYTEALTYFEKVTQNSETLTFQGQALYGQALCEQEKWEAAGQKFLAATQLDSKNAGAYIGRILVAQAQNDEQALGEVLDEVARGGDARLIERLVEAIPSLSESLQARQEELLRLAQITQQLKQLESGL